MDMTDVAIMLISIGESLFMVNLMESARLKALLKGLPAHLTQTNAALGVKIAAVLAATVVLFGQDLTIMFNDALLSETTSYMIVIPFILGYLIYRKRKMLRATTNLKTSYGHTSDSLLLIAGILLIISAVVLYWYGSYTFTPLEYHLIALPLFVSGLILITFNIQTLRQLAFPIALLLLFVPPPEQILYEFGATLSVVSAVASNGIVTTLGVASKLSTEFGSPTITITRPDGVVLPPFAVDITCSGIYSLMGFLVFALFVVYIVRDKPWKRAVLLLIGFPLIYMLNIIRITGILLIGYQFGEALALEVFHLFSGWVLIFVGTLFLLFASEKILKTQIFKPNEKCPKCNPSPSSKLDFCSDCGRITRISRPRLGKGDLTKLTGIILSVALLISIQAPVFALTRNLTIDINTPYGQPVSTNILPNIPGYNLSYQQPAPTKFLIRTQVDLATSFYFTGTGKEPLWITIEVSSTMSNLHTWEKCLITWPISHGLQPVITQIALEDLSLNENPPIIGRFFVFQYQATNETQAVLYWYEKATFLFNSTVQQKYMKISVQAFPNTANAEELQTLKTQMLTVAKDVAGYWEPIKMWSQIALTLSQNGDKLVLITFVLLLITVVALLIDKQRKNKGNFQAYQKMFDTDKEFINIIHKTEKTATPTLSNIQATYRKTLGKSIKQSELMHELQRAEEAGFIERNIVNRNDEPLQAWKTQIAFKPE